MPPRARPQIFTIIFALLAITGLVYLISPWVAAFVRQEQLNRYIKIRVDYPGCIPGNSAPDSFKCECEFIFEGVRTANAVSFQGPSLHKSYAPQTRTYTVSGIGTVASSSNSIAISADRISINGTELPPDRPSSLHVLIRADGKLESSRIEIAY